MKRYNLSSLSESEKEELCRRPGVDFAKIVPDVQNIISAVKQHGDRALLDYTEKFDGVRPDPLVISPPDPDSIELDEKRKEAFNTAFQNIYYFHMAQRPQKVSVKTMDGVSCSRETRPIERVGLYVPGGTAVLPSTALMLGVPAMIAGCPVRVMATPPRPDGSIAPEVLYCAALTGITHIVKAGGSQAVAALAWGTESVPKTQKIFGPGNQYVTCAKMLLQQSDALVAIDMPAGPSELLVIADDSADPAFVAADLLSQAEHGADSQVVFISTSEKLTETVLSQLEEQLQSLPRRQAAEKALSNSITLFAENLDEAIAFSNRWAPEHLILSCRKPRAAAKKITSAGSVFLGNWTPESAGDYASGTNHTLPTSGYAAMYSGVSLESFLKQITFQELSKKGLRELGPVVEIMAESEGLEAHKRAVSLRLERLKIKKEA